MQIYKEQEDYLLFSYLRRCCDEVGLGGEWRHQVDYLRGTSLEETESSWAQGIFAVEGQGNGSITFLLPIRPGLLIGSYRERKVGLQILLAGAVHLT